MRHLRTAVLATLLLGFAACASSVRIGGSSSTAGKWEYKVVHTSQIADLDGAELIVGSLGSIADPDLAASVCQAVEKGLNQLGQEGWELTGVDDGAYVLRRPLEE